MKNMIETKNLTKTYKAFTAVDHVSLHIKKGSIYGFLGPNGAGKSTTMKMLLGLTAPTDGEFQIDNLTFPNNRVQILKKIGSFIESPSFYPNLTGRENLDIIRRILGLPESSVDDALELVGLSEFGNRLAKKYSLGMKQRLGLASALLWVRIFSGAFFVHSAWVLPWPSRPASCRHGASVQAAHCGPAPGFFSRSLTVRHALPLGGSRKSDPVQAAAGTLCRSRSVPHGVFDGGPPAPAGAFPGASIASAPAAWPSRGDPSAHKPAAWCADRFQYSTCRWTVSPASGRNPAPAPADGRSG